MSKVRHSLLLLACLATLLLPHAAAAQENDPDVALSDEQREEALAFAVDNVVFVLYHEIGHLFVGEYGIPVLGREEDAADNLAALMLLKEGGEAADAALISSADGWYWSSLVTGQTEAEDDFAYQGVHSLDIQRSYAIVCLMVGKDSAYFADIADVYELDPERKESCSLDYAQAEASWSALLAPFRRDANTELAGEIEVSYAGAEDYSAVAEAMQAARVLERAEAIVEQDFRFPRPISFEARLCGEQNAYYSPSEGAVTLCYELADFFLGLYISNVFLGEEEVSAPGADWLGWSLTPTEVTGLSTWLAGGTE